MDEIHIYFSEYLSPQKPLDLTNPFLPQHQKIIASTPAPPQGGSSSNTQEFMCDQMVSLKIDLIPMRLLRIFLQTRIKKPLLSLVALSR
jgi:hypothetical protein